MEYTRRDVVRSVVGVSVAALAGCVGSAANEKEPQQTSSGHGNHSHAHGGSTDGPVELANVDMVTTDSGSHFDPHVVHVARGESVRWSVESGSHSSTAYHPDNDEPRLVPDGAKAWDSGVISGEGKTFEHRFETEGVYHYYCTPHEPLGMLGSVIVGDPEPSNQRALGTPPEQLSRTVREKIESLNETCRAKLNDNK